MSPWIAYALGVLTPILPAVLVLGLIWIINRNTVREVRERIAGKDKAAETVVYYDATLRDRRLFEALTR